jgi:hypothetical protein
MSRCPSFEAVFHRDPSALLKKGGDMHKHPVCGMTVDPNRAAGILEFAGQGHFPHLVNPRSFVDIVAALVRGESLLAS